MLTMQNAWERQLHDLRKSNEVPSSTTNNNHRNTYDDYGLISRQHEQEHRRVILDASSQGASSYAPDRSISAPPLSGSGLGLGYNAEDSSTLFSYRQKNDFERSSDIQSTSNRASYIGEESNFERKLQNQQQEPIRPSPSTYQSSLPIGTNRSLDPLDELDYIGDNRNRNAFVRSQSAAPKISIPPPPGMTGGSRSSSSGGPFLFDSMNEILQTGMRRPASTGVIGQNSHSARDGSSPISRPEPKTLMELIQEDFPKTPSPEFGAATDIRAYESLNRPRSASPPRSKTFMAPTSNEYRNVPSNGYGNVYEEEQKPQQVHVSASVHNQNPQVITYVQNGAAPAPQTHYVSIPVSQLQHTGNISVQPTQHVYPVTAVQQHPHYDIQPVYYTSQRSPASANDPIPVYVNAAPYYAVQYASPDANGPPILHHHPSHPISLVPVHHSPNGHAPQIIANNGSYSFWHPPADIQSPPNHLAYTRAPQSMSPKQTQPYGKKSVSSQPKDKTSKRRGNNGSKKQPTSTVLEEFRNSKTTRTWTLASIQGHILQFCQDQNGSRFIQQQLETATADEKQLVLKEILPSIRVLRNDVFGNYVIQKLLEYGTDPIKLSLYTTFQNEMFEMSLQMYGCRVVQKAFETLSYPIFISLLHEFQDNVMTCIHDQNGNHVIQKIIEVLSLKVKLGEGNPSAIDFILDDVLGHVAELSCHPYGCRVMQRILEHCIEDQRVKALDEIKNCHEQLLDDQYGNYVIQHVLQFGRTSDREAVLNIILDRDLLTLSRQKFASNVVEKLLKYGNSEQRNLLVNEMLQEVDGSSVVLWMVRDAYANYVVQTTLDVLAEGDKRTALLEELNNHSSQLKNFTFAKHIVAKLNDK